MAGITSIVLSETLLELEHKGLISKELYPTYRQE